MVFFQEVEGGRLTYREFHDQNLRWAAAYELLGVRAGENVVTMLPASAGAHHAWLGLAWMNAVEVPVNHDYRGRILQYVVAQSRARFLVIPGRFLERLTEIADQLDPNLTVVVPDKDDVDESGPFRVVPRRIFFDAPAIPRSLEVPGFHDICCILYTSGTTGPSKGVLIPWRQLLYTALCPPEDALREREGFYSVWPAFHASGKCGPYLAAVTGGRLVSRDRFSASAFWGDVRKFDCAFTLLGAPLMHFILGQPPPAGNPSHPLRGVWCSPLSPVTTEFGSRFGVKIATAFGMTEIGTPIASEGWNTENWRSCGRVRTGPPGYEIRLVDELDEPVPPGQIGELTLRTDEPWALNAGYYGMPEETARAWRNGWFHTGDAFSVDEEGYFYFVDRLKDCVRRRGENVSSFEVERYVREHESIEECAAIGVPSEHGEEEVKIFVVKKEGATLGAEELFRFLASRMPRFMVPRFIEFATDLPKTDATQRIKKSELRERPHNERTWDREAFGLSVQRY